MRVPDAAPPPIPPSVLRAIEVSVQRFEQTLRNELGIMAGAVNIARYLELYRAEAAKLAVEVILGQGG